MTKCTTCGELFEPNNILKNQCGKCLKAKISGTSRNRYGNESEFAWWRIFAYIVLIVWNAIAISNTIEPLTAEWKTLALSINTMLGLMMLRYNKYAFLFATILSGPLFWIINGIYLKNRWNHPMVNSGTTVRSDLRFAIQATKNHDTVHAINSHRTTSEDLRMIYEKIINDYGNLMLYNMPKPGMVADVNELPHSKELIKEAIIYTIKNIDDHEMISQLKASYCELSNWQKGVGNKHIGFDIEEIQKITNTDKQAEMLLKINDEQNNWQDISYAERMKLLSEINKISRM